MSHLIEQLIQYFHDTLNVTLVVRPWDESRRLPFFLQDSYSYYRTDLHGLDVVLMVDNDAAEHSPAMIRKHVNLVREKCGCEVVYVHHRVSAYNRKRLIEQGVPFVIPANQMYCPMLAIDLREHFRQKHKSVQRFSPATQALVLHWLYRHHHNDADRGTPTEMAKVLGYSKMTMSRAFKEVDAALDTAFVNEHYTNNIKLELEGRELWQRLQPFWRSPVNQRHYLLKGAFDLRPFWRAGLSALANYTMLAEPGHEVYAISQNEWKVLRQREDVVLLDGPDSQAVEVEIWAYAPSLFGRDHMVDPLSLYLSLRDSRDERVESALDQLLEQMPW
ncbi:MAG: hypothetical protein PF568_01135 [Deltaproteobacteria bacterium]|jgi:hypothetical protein|nr:hypothetical protein [Deltaproteobacteria bacterium]